MRRVESWEQKHCAREPGTAGRKGWRRRRLGGIMGMSLAGRRSCAGRLAGWWWWWCWWCWWGDGWMEIDNCFQVHGNAWVQQLSCWDLFYSCAEEFEWRILLASGLLQWKWQLLQIYHFMGTGWWQPATMKSTFEELNCTCTIFHFLNLWSAKDNGVKDKTRVTLEIGICV